MPKFKLCNAIYSIMQQPTDLCVEELVTVVNNMTFK